MQCSAPAVWVVPPRFCDSEYITALLLPPVLVYYPCCVYMHLSWATDFTHNAGLPPLGLLPDIPAASPSPFKSSLKPSWILPVHELDFFCLNREVQPIQFQQAMCHKSCPMIKEPEILRITPILEPLVDYVGSPIPFTVFLCHQKGWGEDYLCSCPINQLTFRWESPTMTTLLFFLVLEVVIHLTDEA